MTRALRALAAAGLLAAAACGETRRTIGEECIRNDDCLSDVCSARECVGQPPLISGASGGAPTDGVGVAPPVVADGGIDEAGEGSDGSDEADGGGDAADGG